MKCFSFCIFIQQCLTFALKKLNQLETKWTLLIASDRDYNLRCVTPALESSRDDDIRVRATDARAGRRLGHDTLEDFPGSLRISSGSRLRWRASPSQSRERRFPARRDNVRLGAVVRHDRFDDESLQLRVRSDGKGIATFLFRLNKISGLTRLLLFKLTR